MRELYETLLSKLTNWLTPRGAFGRAPLLRETMVGHLLPKTKVPRGTHGTPGAFGGGSASRRLSFAGKCLCTPCIKAARRGGSSDPFLGVFPRLTVL